MEHLGDYRVVGELGRGGMGVVYRAEDPIIGRPLAIKVILLDDVSDLGERQVLRERLFREARSAGSLAHPGIVTVHHVGEQLGLPYIVMEYVAGMTIEKLMSNNAPTAGDLIQKVVRQVSAALDYAHRKGIVHRDIKPSNLMLNEEGWLKICDFGIAKRHEGDLSMTKTGTVMGTPQYMSPEQLKGSSVDGRSDQYSLAAVVFQMLTGQRLFEAETIETLFCKVLYEDPAPLCQAKLGLIPGLPSVLARALCKDAARRYETCCEFADAFLSTYKPAMSCRRAEVFPDVRPVEEVSETSRHSELGATIIGPLPGPPSGLDIDHASGLPEVERGSVVLDQVAVSETPTGTVLPVEPSNEAKSNEETTQDAWASHWLRGRTLAVLVGTGFLVLAMFIFSPTRTKKPTAELASVRSSPVEAPPGLLGTDNARSTSYPGKDQPAEFAKSTALSASPLFVSKGNVRTDRATGLSGAGNSIVPLPPPRIEKFVVDPASVMRGAEVVLSWDVSSASEIRIEPGIGLVEPSGLRRFIPQTTTMYILTAQGSGDGTTAQALLTVTAPPPDAPVPLIPQSSNSSATTQPRPQGLQPSGETIAPRRPSQLPAETANVLPPGVAPGAKGVDLGRVPPQSDSTEIRFPMEMRTGKELLKQGEVQYRSSRYEDAVVTLTSALLQNPEWPEALFERARSLCKLAKYKEAVEDLNKALSLKNGDAAALNLRGYARYNLALYKEAVGDLSEAIRLQPSSAEAFLNRGNSKWQLGDRVGAEADFRMARALEKGGKR